MESSSPFQPTHTDIDRLLAAAACSHAALARRDRALLEVLCDAGVQASELVRLNVADVDSVHGTLLCGAGSHRQRTLKLSQSATIALVDYLAHERTPPDDTRIEAVTHDEQPLFRNHRGQRLTRQGVWMIVRAYAATIGLDGKITPRSLRHRVATRLRQSGIGPREIRKQLGINRLVPDGQNKEEIPPRLLLDGKIAIP
jgi:integrase/recombinase XerD